MTAKDAAAIALAAAGESAPEAFEQWMNVEGFAHDLGNSFERYGFAVIGEHGLDQPMLDEMTAKAL
jgi:isopenicillin N synthase-like dioxygenase